MTGSNANGPTVLKYSAYSESLKSFTGRYCASQSQIENMTKSITIPPNRVEMRYKKDQSKNFFVVLDAYKTIKPSSNAANAAAVAQAGKISSLDKLPASQGSVSQSGNSTNRRKS